MTILVLREISTDAIYYDKADIYEIMVELSWKYGLFNDLLKKDGLVDEDNCCDAAVEEKFTYDYYNKHKDEIMEDIIYFLKQDYEIFEIYSGDCIILEELKK